MKRGQRASKELRQKVVAAHANGTTVDVLVKKYKVSSNSIYRWTKGKRKQKPQEGDPIEMMADSLLATIRVQLVHGIRELVKLGVQHTVEQMIASMQKRIGIVDVA